MRPLIIRNLTFLTSYTPTPPPAIPTSSMLLYSIPTQGKSSSSSSSQDQNRRANIGHMVSYLRRIIPEALHTLPESQYLDENIILRVAPSVSTGLPILKGRVSYLATLRATQFIMGNLVLNKGVKLHIRSIDVQKGVGNVTNFCSNLQDDYEESIREGIGYGIYDWTTKLVIKWRTCEDGCEHLSAPHRTGFAKRSGIILERFDVKKLWGGGGHHEENQRLINGLQDQNNDEEECEIGGRVIHGIFVFELDKNCEKILVHNVENIEMFEKKDFVDDGRTGFATSA